MKKMESRWIVLVLFMTIFLSACSNSSTFNEFSHTPDLVLYTTLSESIYRPIIKEFQERNQLWIEVKEGSEEAFLAEQKQASSETSCDLIFGISQDSLETNANLFSFHAPFISSPLVIIYNTNVVTYREEPVGFTSLIEEHWKDRIGFVDPDLSIIYQKAFNFAANRSKNPDTFKKQLLDNIGGDYAASMEDIMEGVAKGYYSVGVTSEEAAKFLMEDGAEITYLHPAEGDCIILQKTAILKNCANLNAAQKFLDFTTSDDVKQLLENYLNCLPAKTFLKGGNTP
ncbi:MAG: extracellular solute-binding protein [Clostridiales bacterium]|jgi:iron(III) transport system substrate-binding protein|nr:extracellular solute-binding protein [Clostridiales bacterium]